MATNPQLASLLGTGPPEGLGRMQVARWGVKNPPKDPQVSFSGKTVLVTGSNTGLGYAAALKFAALGASKLILGVRSIAKGEDAKARIIAATKREASSIVVIQLDMGSFESVRAFVKMLEKEVGNDNLDVAVLNAGIAAPKYEINESTGWETALQINILSTALLAILLMPILKRTASKSGQPSQLTLTGSSGHTYVTPSQVQLPNGKTVLETINAPEFFELEKSYCVIKLLTMYVMQGLIDDYSKNANGETDVWINVACPGYCSTDLGREFPWYVTWPTKLMQLYYGRSSEQGGRSLVSATLLGEAGHGKFWTNDIFAK